MKSKISFETFGCKVNSYDTGLLQKRLHAAGFLSSSDKPSIHVLNTCAVTAEATREAVRRIRKLKVENPFSTVVVTGCAAQVDTDVFAQMPGADLVVANSHKGELESILKSYFRGEIKQKVFRSNIFKKEEVESGGGENELHTRSFLKIQDGCNSFCTYCVIPFARGKSRSISVEDLVRRVNELTLQGVREVVITGIHIGDYEDRDQNGNKLFLEDLVENLLEKTKMPRFRISSLEPLEVSDRLLKLYQDNDRLCPHFHMSIQSAEDSVLKGMKRKYLAHDVTDSLLRIQSVLPQSYIGMDVITGFPGETEESFAITVKNLEKSPWTRLHVFPYSERPGTKAVHLSDSVPVEVRKQRAKFLREMSSDRLKQQAVLQVGTTKKALILRQPAMGANSVARDYWHMVTEGGEPFAGQEVLVQVTGFDHSQSGLREGLLFAKLLN